MIFITYVVNDTGIWMVTFENWPSGTPAVMENLSA